MFTQKLPALGQPTRTHRMFCYRKGEVLVRSDGTRDFCEDTGAALFPPLDLPACSSLCATPATEPHWHLDPTLGANISVGLIAELPVFLCWSLMKKPHSNRARGLKYKTLTLERGAPPFPQILGKGDELKGCTQSMAHQDRKSVV